MILPLTCQMKLTMNDRHAIARQEMTLRLSSREFSERVMARLGIAWMVKTIRDIGEDAWCAFVAKMPPLPKQQQPPTSTTGSKPRQYTLTFVFSEAWSVALDAMDEWEHPPPHDTNVDEIMMIPSLEEFTNALCHSFQLAPASTLAASIAAYYEAAQDVLTEQSHTFLTLECDLDRLSSIVAQRQYHSVLTCLSAIACQRRQRPYQHLRPYRTILESPRAWWRFAIHATRRDIRKRLAKIDWTRVHFKKKQMARYVELYVALHDDMQGEEEEENSRQPFDPVRTNIYMQTIPSPLSHSSFI
jgi:hypothetical protein